MRIFTLLFSLANRTFWASELLFLLRLEAAASVVRGGKKRAKG